MEICNNEQYSIVVDKEKNRIELTMRGFWSSSNIVPNYLTDIGKAVAAVSPGFTVLTDVASFKVPTGDVFNLLAEGQKKFMAKGVTKVASLANPSSITKMAAERMTQSTGINRRPFTSRDEAIKWLDEKS